MPSAHVSKFEDVPGTYTKITVGEPVDGWLSYADSGGADTSFRPDALTMASDPLLLYFTSGTTAKPKLVKHTHASYPVGHLSRRRRPRRSATRPASRSSQVRWGAHCPVT